MMKLVFFSFLFLFFVFPGVSYSQTPVDSVYWTGVPKASLNDQELIDLARSGQPTTLSISGDVFLRNSRKVLADILKAECGVSESDEIWERLFNETQRQNSNQINAAKQFQVDQSFDEALFEPTLDGTTRIDVNIPFCTNSLETRVISKGDTIGQILAEALPGAPENHFETLYNLNTSYFDNQIKNFLTDECSANSNKAQKVICASKRIKPGDVFKLPGSEAPPKDFFFSDSAIYLDSYELCPSIMGLSISDCVRGGSSTPTIGVRAEGYIAAKFENATKVSLPPTNILRYGAVDENSLTAVDKPKFDQECSGTTLSDYPYDEELVWERLVGEIKLAKENTRLSPAKVGLIDSGVVFKSPQSVTASLPDSLFLTYGSPNDLEKHDDFQRYGKNFRASTNPKYGGYILPFPTTPKKGHGTEVAHMLYGGPEFKNRILDEIKLETSLFENKSPIMMRVFSLNSRPNEEISAYHFSEGVEYLSRRKRKHATYGPLPLVQIINISAAQIDSDGFLKSKLADSEDYLDVLFVVGAGNEKEKLSVQERYPASLGGISSPNIMTVGAHGMNKGLLPFSARGYDSVDILAPGCNIKTVSIDGSYSIKSGTSYAAPLVAFTASLITYLNPEFHDYDWEPQKIKNRIIYSSDYIDLLDQNGLVSLGAILNIPRSISVRSDILTLDNESKFGEIDKGFVKNLKIYCGDKVGFRTKRFILKFTPQDRISITRLLVSNKGNVIKDFSCDATDDARKNLISKYLDPTSSSFKQVAFVTKDDAGNEASNFYDLSKFSEIDLLLSEN